MARPVTVGEKIKSLRISQNLTQKDLANKLDITRQAVARWERNVNMPSAAKLIELSKIFEVSVDDLCKDTERSKSNQVKSRLTSSLMTFCAYSVLWLLLNAYESSALPFHAWLTETWWWCNRFFITWIAFSISVFASICGFSYISRLTFAGLFLGIACSAIWSQLVWSGYAELYNGFAVMLPIAALFVILGCFWEHKIGKSTSGEGNSSLHFSILCAYVILLISISAFYMFSQLSYISGANSGWKSGFDNGRNDFLSGGEYNYEILSPPEHSNEQESNGWRSYYPVGYMAGYNVEQ